MSRAASARGGAPGSDRAAEEAAQTSIVPPLLGASAGKRGRADSAAARASKPAVSALRGSSGNAATEAGTTTP